MSKNPLRPGDVGKVFLDVEESRESFHGDLPEQVIYDDLRDVASEQEIGRIIARAEEIGIITRLAPGLLLWGRSFQLVREYKEAKGLMPEERLRKIQEYTFDLNRRSRRWEQEYASRCRDFLDERLPFIDAGDVVGFLPLSEPPLLALHVIPGVPLKKDDEQAYQYLSSLTPQSLPVRPMNLVPMSVEGGFVGDDYQTYVYSQAGGSVFSYLRIFRNGSIEAVRASYFIGGQPRLHVKFEREVVDLLRRLPPLLQGIGVKLPVGVSLSLSGARGFRMADDNDVVAGGSGVTMSGDRLLTPLVTIESFESLADQNEVAQIMRDSFDRVWQAAGHLGGSPNFGGRGEWKPC
jgi:hypothetical protein